MNIERPKSRLLIPPDAKRVFKGKIFDVYHWEQNLFDGSKAVFEKLKRRDSVNVFPITDDGKIIVTEQQQPAHVPFWGSIGGGREDGESLIECAGRELLEESGYTAKKFVLFSATQPSSIIDWAIYSFVAKGCKKIVNPAPDAGEKITLHFLTLDEFIELARNPKFRDLEVSLNIFRAIGTKDGYEALKSLFSPE